MYTVYMLSRKKADCTHSGATSQLMAMKCVVWRSATQLPTGGMFATCTPVLVSCHSVYTLDMLTLFQCRADQCEATKLFHQQGCPFVVYQ